MNMALTWTVHDGPQCSFQSKYACYYWMCYFLQRKRALNRQVIEQVIALWKSDYKNPKIIKNVSGITSWWRNFIPSEIRKYVSRSRFELVLNPLIKKFKKNSGKIRLYHSWNRFRKRTFSILDVRSSAWSCLTKAALSSFWYCRILKRHNIPIKSTLLSTLGPL